MKKDRRRGDWDGFAKALEMYQKCGTDPNHISLYDMAKKYHIGVTTIPKYQFVEIYKANKIDDSNKDKIIEDIYTAAREHRYSTDKKRIETDEKPSTLTWDIQLDGIQDKQIIDELKRRGYVIYQKIIKTELKEV